MVLIAQLRIGVQDDPDVFKGVLAGVFANALPPAVAAKKFEDALYDEGFCYGAALEEITADDVREVCKGNRGEAILVLRAIRAPEGVVVPIVVHGPPQEARPTSVRPFPEVGANGYPTLRDFDAFSEGFTSRVELSVSAETMVQVEAVGANPRVAIAAEYEDGGGDDRTLYRVLVNEAKLPAETVAMVPHELRKAKAGLKVWQFLSAGVHTKSDAASLEVLSFVTSPTPLQPAQQQMLGSVYQSYVQGVEKLSSEGNPVSELQQKKGLKRLVGAILELARKWELLEGADSLDDVPIADYRRLVQKMSDKYSSHAQVKEAYGAVNVLAVGVHAKSVEEDKAPRDHFDQACKWWKLGTCWRESKCRFKHSGKPCHNPVTRSQHSQSYDSVGLGSQKKSRQPM